jgi:hypothetical protein
MNCWLTRQRDGNFMLTALKPSVHAVRGAGFDDAYVVPGDPVGFRNMCAGAVSLIWGLDAGLMRRLQSCRVAITGRQRDVDLQEGQSVATDC